MASILSDSTNSEQEQDMLNTVSQAYRLLIQDRSTQAITRYKQCIQKYPNCWRAYQNLGVAYIMIKEYENAYQILKKYVQHVPKDPLGHDSLGVSYSQLNDPLQAIACFVNAINLSPAYYMSYYNLGVVLGKLNLNQQALNVYKRCLQLHPSYINAMNNIADIYKKFNDIENAINIFNSILEIDPTYVLGIKNLANCYLEKKQYFQALITYLKFIQIEPNRQSVLVNLAVCLDHFQLYSEAANCLVKIYDLANNKNQDLLITKLFIAGSLYCRELHQINKYIRVYVRFQKRIPQILKQTFNSMYLSAIQCYQIVYKTAPKFKQSIENIYRIKINLISYKAKIGEAFSILDDLKNEDFQLEEPKRIKPKLIQQKRILNQINSWRPYLKRLIKKFKIHKKDNQQQLKYLSQKQKVSQIFQRKYSDITQIKYKTKSYISRTFNHNIKLLILKRHKFIKKFNKFNSEFQMLFKYKHVMTTLNDNDDNDSGEGIIVEQN